MPRVSRSRTIAAPEQRVWDLVRDPHSLPRWWPRTTRVEDVREPGGGLASWTAVLSTERGAAVRADFRCTALEPPARYAWEQEIAETPFERILRSSRLEISLSPAGEGTDVTLTSDESLRGLSRLGATMMRGAAGRRLEEALDGIGRAVGDGDG